MKILLITLLTSLSLHAQSAKVGNGKKYHAFNKTNATATACGFTHNITKATNAVDCLRCLKPRK